MCQKWCFNFNSMWNSVLVHHHHHHHIYIFKIIMAMEIDLSTIWIVLSFMQSLSIYTSWVLSFQLHLAFPFLVHFYKLDFHFTYLHLPFSPLMASGVKIKMWSAIATLLLMLLSSKPLLAEGEEPQVPCYFIFGDSLVDNGNNNNLSTEAKANYFPYGIDFPDGPTGRFSNGRNLADYLGLHLFLSSNYM